MAREAKHRIEQQDIIFREIFDSEFDVRRRGGDPDAGATSPTFFNGIATFDGVTAQINYPRDRFHLCQPERAFSIRTRVYMTDTDASSFVQIYDNTGNKELRFLISSLWPNAADYFALELWDSAGTAGHEEMRGRRYNTLLTDIARDKWVEFVATYDGRGGATPEAGICLYMDGVRVDDADIADDNGGDYVCMRYNSELDLEIGRNVEGSMEFVEIWNRVLSPEQVANLANV